MSGAADLSGQWQGMFSYPGGAESTAFTADLTDSAGLLAGVIVKPNVFSPALLSIEAMVDGHRQGTTVRFTKFYDDPSGHYDCVLYAGTLDEDGSEIAGRWDIPGAWSGTFVMIHDRPTSAAIEGGQATEVRQNAVARAQASNAATSSKSVAIASTPNARSRSAWPIPQCDPAHRPMT